MGNPVLFFMGKLLGLGVQGRLGCVGFRVFGRLLGLG